MLAVAAPFEAGAGTLQMTGPTERHQIGHRRVTRTGELPTAGLQQGRILRLFLWR